MLKRAFVPVCYILSIICFAVGLGLLLQHDSAGGGLALTASAFFLLLTKQERLSSIHWGNLKAQFSLDSDATGEIKIFSGTDGQYVRTYNANAYNVIRSVCIGVKNTGGSFISNCHVYSEARKPGVDDKERWLVDGPFTLNPGEERYVQIASYSEPVPPQRPPTNDEIRLCAPPSGTFWRPPSLAAAGGIVEVFVDCAESKQNSMVMKFWVAGDRLNWAAF